MSAKPITISEEGKKREEVEKKVEEIIPPEKRAEIEKPPPLPEKVEKPPPLPEKKPSVVAPPSPPPPAPPPPKKSETLIKIEKILEEDLEDLYLSLSPEKQKEFKEKGEEVASKVEKIIKSVKVKAKEILNLIKEWLKIIPGINKFFLEQEAKIKTDKILFLGKIERGAEEE